MDYLNNQRVHLPFFLLAVFILSIGYYIIATGDLNLSSSTTGAVATTLFITDVSYVTCNATLLQGYNLVSLYCIPNNNTVDYIFSDYMTNITSIHSYFALSNDSWKAFNPNLPSWVVQDYQNIQHKDGFWIVMKENTSISINGSYIVPSIIPLETGWNMIGYPIRTTTYINKTAADLAGLYSLILMYNASDSLDQWKSYNPNGNPSFNDLSSFFPLYGYWINMTQSVVWTVDD